MKYLVPLAACLLVTAMLQAAESPYAGQQYRSIKSLSDREVTSLLNGDGMGFAKPAELNHYPGPKHVLELADELALTPSQQAETEALYEAMRSDAQALGKALLAAEAGLDQAFAKGAVDAASLEDRVLEIGEIRARLRYVHLAAHLRQKALLTEAQVARYDTLRGYDRENHEHAGHPGHHE